MALYLIGLGLCDQKDITVKGLEIVKNCQKLYLETYTAFLQCDVTDLEKFYGKKVHAADREFIENHSVDILAEAQKQDVAVLVVGDPLIATTHIELLIEAKKKGIQAEVVHNASVITAIGLTGLHIYKFGRTISIPYARQNVESPYDLIAQNKKQGMHTLVLMDLKQKENVTIQEAIDFLLQLEKKKKQGIFTAATKYVACARLGCKDALICYGTATQIRHKDFGKPPFCLIIPGELHFKEEEYLDTFRPISS